MNMSERAPHAGDGFAAVAAVRDQFGHQGIVVRRNHAVLKAAVSTRTPMPPGRFKPVMRPGEGAKVSGFSALMRHSMAWPAQLDRAGQNVGSGLACGDADLALHQIDAGDHLGDRMLHLNARVDFDEVEVAGLVHQELDRAGIGVARRRAWPRAAFRKLRLAHVGLQRRRRRFFQQFLMAPLDAALALAENLDVAVLVGQHLKFDVARRRE